MSSESHAHPEDRHSCRSFINLQHPHQRHRNTNTNVMRKALDDRDTEVSASFDVRHLESERQKQVTRRSEVQ